MKPNSTREGELVWPVAKVWDFLWFFQSAKGSVSKTVLPGREPITI